MINIADELFSFLLFEATAINCLVLASSYIPCMHDERSLYCVCIFLKIFSIDQSTCY